MAVGGEIFSLETLSVGKFLREGIIKQCKDTKFYVETQFEKNHEEGEEFTIFKRLQ